MKIGSRDNRFYVGWYSKHLNKVVYTWFDSFDAANSFFERESGV